MKETVESKSSTESLGALLLFCIFTFCVLFVLLFGTRVYSSVIARDTDTHVELNCAQYVYTQIRANHGNYEIGTIGDLPCLYLHNYNDSPHTCTAIYVYDGWLCELLYIDDAEADFAPDDGTKVIEATSIAFQGNGNLIDISIVSDSGKLITFSCYCYPGNAEA